MEYWIMVHGGSLNLSPSLGCEHYPEALRQHGVPLAGLQPCSVWCEPVSTRELSRCQARMGLGWGGGALTSRRMGGGPDSTVAGFLQGTDSLSSWASQWWPCFAQGAVSERKYIEGLRGEGAESEDPWGQPAWEVISLLLSTLGTVPAPHPLLVLYWAQISLPSKRGITLLAYRRSINK